MTYFISRKNVVHRESTHHFILIGLPSAQFGCGSTASIPRRPPPIRLAGNFGRAGSLRTYELTPERLLAAFSFLIRSKILFGVLWVLKLLETRGGRTLVPLELRALRSPKTASDLLAYRGNGSPAPNAAPPAGCFTVVSAWPAAAVMGSGMPRKAKAATGARGARLRPFGSEFLGQPTHARVVG
jgi:hypothetical protein